MLTRRASLAKQHARVIYRKLPLNLFELEPESGEDEDIGVDLDLDQVEE
jgi:hypothetical protein